MAAHTTTIRVRRDTQLRLRAVSEASGTPAAELIDRWARAADEELTLASAAAAWDSLSGEPKGRYRAETHDLDTSFPSDLPEY